MPDATPLRSSIVPALDYQGRQARRAGSEARRIAILEAVLRIIAREGTRGVRHRAVAREAGVPLAATTYYFQDIDALITDAFNLFAERSAVQVERFRAELQVWLEQGMPVGVSHEAIVEDLAGRVMAYIREQTGALRDQRLLEQAFILEGLRNERLRGALQMQERHTLSSVRTLFALAGTGQPEADASIARSVVVQMELLLMWGGEAAEQEALATLRRLLSYLLVDASVA